MRYTNPPLSQLRKQNYLLKMSCATIAALSLLFSMAPLYAANETWIGGNSPDGNWNTNANWSTAIPVMDDQLFFDGSTGLLNTNNIVSNTEFGGITFNSTASSFTLNGNQLTLANGGGITNNSALPQTNNLSGGGTGLAVTNNNIFNYITTPGGGLLVFKTSFAWANAVVTNSTLIFSNAKVKDVDAGATSGFGIGGNNNSVSNTLILRNSIVDGNNSSGISNGRRINTANGLANQVILDNSIATNIDGLIVGNGGASYNNTLIVSNGSKIYINGTDLYELGRNTGSRDNNIIITGPGSAILSGGHAFAIGGSSGSTTNGSVQVNNGGLWNLGGSTFRLNFSGPQMSLSANNGTISNVFSMIIGNGNYSNSVTLANGSKFNFSGSSGDFRELGRGGNANNNKLTLTDPNTRWDNGGATITIGGTASGANNFSNIMTIASSAVFTNGGVTIGGQGSFQTLVISNATAYINALILNGGNSAVYLQGGNSDSAFFDTLGNNATGLITNSASTTDNVTIGWNNGSQTANPPPVIGGLINITKTGSGSQNLNNANSFIGNVLVAGGTLGSGAQQAAADGSFSAFGCLTNSGKTITITNGGTLSLTVNKALLNGLTPDTLPAITVYSGGTLNSSRFNALGQIVLNGGTLLQNSSDGSPLNGYQFFTNVSIGGSAPAIISVGANGLPDDLYNAAAGGTTFNVANTASGGADLTVSAPLADYSNDGVTALGGSLNKTGAGIMMSTGTNTYTGLTTVSSGELGFGSYSPQAGGITVKDGAILDVTVSGASQMVPSALTLGNSTGAAIQFVNLANTTPAPVIATNLTLNGTVTVNLKFPSIVANTKYPLITYTTLSGSGSTVLGAGRSGSSMFLTNINNGDGTTNLTLYVVSPGSPTNDIWTGANSASWNSTTVNWTAGINPATYFEGDAAFFFDSSSVTNVTLAMTVNPGNTTFSNNTRSYTLISSAGTHIDGAGGLTKQGSGSLTITNLVNTYSGNNMLMGGTVIANSELNLGANTNSIVISNATFSAVASFSLNSSRSVTIDPATINVVTNQTLTYNGVLADIPSTIGSLIKTGPGTLSLGGPNTYSGTTLVSGGKLIVTTAQQSGGAFTVSDTSALSVVASGGATLPMSSLTLGTSGNTTLTLQGLSGTNAPVTATNLTANGTVGVVLVGGTIKIGEVPLVKYSTLSGGIGNFTLASPLPPNIVGVLTNDTAGKFIGLSITAINGLTWTGANGNFWDIATTTNWVFGTTNSIYTDTGAVLFNDSGANNVSIRTLVSPASVVVNNSSITYTFSQANASAGIGGSGGFTKLGLGTMNYATVTNSYAGVTVIGRGQITLGAHPTTADPGSALLEFSTNSVFITNNAFLQLNGVGGGPTVWAQYMSNAITLDNGNIFGTDGGQHLDGPMTIGPNGAALGEQQTNKFLFIDGPLSGTGTISVPLPNGGVNDGIHTPGGGGYAGPYFTQSGNPYSGTISLFNGNIGVQDVNGTCLANAILDLEGYNGNLGQPLIWTLNASFTMTLAGLAGANPAVNLNLDSYGGIDLILGNNSSGTVVYQGILSGHATTAFGNVTKIGGGSQWLVGTNTYSGATTISSGELGISTSHAGGGSFAAANGAGFGVTNLGPSSASISSLTLGTGGATTVEFQNVSNTAAPLVICGGGLVVNGPSTVKINGTNGLAPGNTYPLITASGGISGSGGFTLSLPPGISGSLVTNGGNTIALSIVAGANLHGTNITMSVSSGNMTLSWPADYIGWTLQVQTNSLSTGISTNWFDVPNSTTTNQIIVPITLTNGTVFFRMLHP